MAKKVLKKTQAKSQKPKQAKKVISKAPKAAAKIKAFKMKKMAAGKIPSTYKLADGSIMPSIGLGTWLHQDGDSMYNAIMKAGYVHIDTAEAYGNLECIGEVLKKCFAAGKKREDLFIASKIWHASYKDGAPKNLKGQLKKLGLDYIDLFYIHWPRGFFATPKCPVHKVWPGMEKCVE